MFHWITFLAVISAIGFPLWRPYEYTVRYAGLGLQLLGIGMVAWGIRETRKLFGHPTFFQRVRRLLRDFPPYGGRVVTLRGHAVAGAATAWGRASVWNRAGPDATIEQRIEAIEKNLASVGDGLAQFQNATDREIRQLDDSIRQEHESRVKEDQDIQTLLTATETGGLHISAMGAFLLFVGVTMSTISSELARFLQRW